jgi:3'(2'), 5'-bisphosphate nucleotidase
VSDDLAALAPAWGPELTTAGRLAREAGVLVLSYRDGELAVEMKPGDEPVTAADRAASDLIVAGLRAAFPGDVVISEENADDPARRSAARVWFVDPIDGTKDFIRREDGFCVMIGLAVDHRPALGAIYQPISRRLFLAAPDAGAHLLVPGEAPRRIDCSGIDVLSEVRLVASKSHRTAAMDRVKSALGIDDELNIGSVGLKLALIAAGERDLYVNTSGKTSSWDSCAPEAILREAGGRVTDLDGEPLRYHDATTQNRRGVLASNRHVHDAALEKLAGLLPSLD